MPGLVWAASLIATLASLGLALPQIARVRRTGQAAGVSLPGWVNGSLSFTGWVGYVVLTGTWALLPATLLPAIPWIWATVLVARVPGVRPAPRAWLPVLAWGAALTAAFVLGALVSPAIPGAVLAISAVWSYGPQAWTAWTATRIDGIAAGTYWLAIAEAVAYGYVGLHDAAVVVWAVIAVALSAAVILGVARRGTATA